MKIDFIEYQHQHEFLYNECANIIGDFLLNRLIKLILLIIFLLSIFNNNHRQFLKI